MFVYNFKKKDFMPYKKEELLALPDEEKIALAEELWSSVEDKNIPLSDEEIAFAEERLKLYNQNPADSLSIEECKKIFFDKYGI